MGKQSGVAIMGTLVLLAIALSVCKTASSAAEAYYSPFSSVSYGAVASSPYRSLSFGYPVGYTTGYSGTPAAYGYTAPIAYRQAAVSQAAPVVTSAAPKAVIPDAVVTEVRNEVDVPSVTSSQFHAQDEDGNYSFGYKNANGFRVESGNSLTGVSGSYSDGLSTYNYVADDWGFRHV